MMNALSIIQPYPLLITKADKPVENRDWPPPGDVLGTQIAIHSSGKLDFETIDYYSDGYRDWKTFVTADIQRNARGTAKAATMRFYKTPNLDSPEGEFEELSVVGGAVIGVARLAAAVHRNGEYKVPKSFYRDATGAMLRNDQIDMRITLLRSYRQNPWFTGDWALVLRDVVHLPQPVPCKGALKFWPLPADIEIAVRSQLAPAGQS